MAHLRSSMASVIATSAVLAVGWGCGSTPTTPTVPSLPPILKVVGNRTVLAPSEKVQLSAVWDYQSTLPDTDLTAKATWTSSDPSVVDVSPGGLVTAIAMGTTDVTARLNLAAVPRPAGFGYESLTGTTTVRVVQSHGTLTGTIDPTVAADIITYNQDALSANLNRQKGTITRCDLPIHVFVDASWIKVSKDAKSYAEHAAKAWLAPIGLPYELVDHYVEPVIVWMSMEIEDHRARTYIQSTNLDNSARRVEIIIPTSWGGISDTDTDTYVHEFGHALGLHGHPDWGGVLQYLPPGPSPLRQPCPRELQFIVELYRLPNGAHLERDGTWVVR